jgi:Holliday junction resolvase RusA-like endonuclease
MQRQNTSMELIQIKPLSVNEAWQGKRFKTIKYKDWVNNSIIQLKSITIPNTDKLKLIVVFGVSNKASDIDNPLKPLLDLIQKKYGINDNRFYKLEVTKEIVKKGKEFIKFDIQEFK